MVNEYEEDELADDSDDEKGIARAVATAERKASQLKRKLGQGGYVTEMAREAPIRAFTYRIPDIQVPEHYGQLVRVLHVQRLDIHGTAVRRTCHHGRIL